jgi:sirohydrochlorin cobaltochelatase
LRFDFLTPELEETKRCTEVNLATASAILVVGHGTRKPAGAAQLRQLVETMRLLAPDEAVFESFLELAEPTIGDAMKRIQDEGFRRVKVVPVLLFEAGHARSDIPDAVAEAATLYGIEVVGQSPPLGTAPYVLTLSDERFNEIAQHGREQGCPKHHCARAGVCQTGCWLQGQELGSIGLAMVGRGTSDVAALEHMRELTRLVAIQRPICWQATGFFAGGSPNVDELLDQAAASACDTILVQPHLLFEGELMDQLRTKLRDRSSRHAPQRWLLARTLGADPGLARVFLELASR